MPNESKDEKISSENSNFDDNTADVNEFNALQGKTLLIYWTLLKSANPLGIRELQRLLKFSSPSLVSYHIKKLEEQHLIDKNQVGAYFVVRKANIVELRDLIIFRILDKTWTVPRMFFYSLTFTILLLCYIPIFIFFDNLFITNSFFFALIFGILGNIFLWYETYKSYKGLPI